LLVTKDYQNMQQN